MARARILSEYIEISIDISNQVSNNRIAQTIMKTITLEVLKVQGAICIRFYSKYIVPRVYKVSHKFDTFAGIHIYLRGSKYR